MMEVENAERVLQNLIHIGAVTEEQIRAAEGFTPEEETTAKVLHTLFCRKGHGALEGECSYYDGDIETVQPWIDNLRALCSATSMKPVPLVELAAGIAQFLESKGMAYQVIATAILSVGEDFTLAEFLASEDLEGVAETEEIESPESSSSDPQTPPLPPVEERKVDLEKPEPESPDQVEPHQATSGGLGAR